MSNLLLGQLLAIIMAIAAAENSLIYSYLGKKVTPKATVHVRLWIAVPLIIILAFITEGNFFISTSLKTWIILLSSGIIGYFICDSLAFWAFANIGPREAMVIMTLNPIINSVLSYFLFTEILTALQIIAILVTISGIIILLLNQDKETDTIKKKHQAKGILFAFLAAILQAVSALLAKSALSTLEPISTNAIRMIGGFIASVLFALFIRKEFKQDFLLYKNKRYFALLVLAAVSGPIIGMSLFLKSFTLAPIGIVTAISQVSPIFILIFELIFLKKSIKSLEILGTIISVIGVALMFI